MKNNLLSYRTFEENGIRAGELLYHILRPAPKDDASFIEAVVTQANCIVDYRNTVFAVMLAEDIVKEALALNIDRFAISELPRSILCNYKALQEQATKGSVGYIDAMCVPFMGVAETLAYNTGGINAKLYLFSLEDALEYVSEFNAFYTAIQKKRVAREAEYALKRQVLQPR